MLPCNYEFQRRVSRALYAFALEDKFLGKKMAKNLAYGLCLYNEFNINVKRAWNCGIIWK